MGLNMTGTVSSSLADHLNNSVNSDQHRAIKYIHTNIIFDHYELHQ
jgi:hypothetical protein